MIDEFLCVPAKPNTDKFSPALGIFKAWRLQIYGYAVAAIYAAFLVSVYRAGTWLVDSAGVPVYTDFACAWAAAVQSLHGDAASLYDPAEFVRVQAALVGPRDYFYPNWPYPPTFFLILAPFTTLPYGYAFITWDIATLLGFIVVVYFIVRRLPAVALVLASPFTVWNFLAGQNGFLTGSLLGASLLFLDRQPVLAGFFIGSLTYKPQFGILLPVALAAARQWRALASAVATAGIFAGISIAVFGFDAWMVLPRELAAQTSEVLLAAGNDDPTAEWGYLQTVYGVVRNLNGGATLAWLVQGAATSGAAIIVWLVWRSPVRYALKAATLAAAALLSTPYAFAYDMAAIAVPVAFLASDQVRHGFLRGEQIILIGLFGASLAVLVAFGDRPGGITFGSTPIGPLVMITLLGVIVRRVCWCVDTRWFPHWGIRGVVRRRAALTA
jgi:arabinofuranan 3-O-arabinosyltransferase